MGEGLGGQRGTSVHYDPSQILSVPRACLQMVPPHAEGKYAVAAITLWGQRRCLHCALLPHMTSSLPV